MPLGDILVIMPPLAIETDILEELLGAVRDCISRDLQSLIGT